MSWKNCPPDAAWKRTRAAVLARDNHRCQINGPGCTEIATTVHHTVGRGVSESMNDLLAACTTCNYAIGDPSRHTPPPRPRTQWRTEGK